jgi:ribonucleoside-diphosphate reductase alpha chain
MTEKITKELLEKSIEEHSSFCKMVCENKYGHKDIKDVIEGVIEYCNITDEAQKELLRSGKFIPAGSILSACNSNNENVSFSNCYLTKIEKDSMDGIFECQKNLANTFKYRGGSGFDITILRPKNSKVNNAANTSSGAVSFMPSFSEVGRVVGTNGRR